jgi:hypothetical protein
LHHVPGWENGMRHELRRSAERWEQLRGVLCRLPGRRLLLEGIVRVSRGDEPVRGELLGSAKRSEQLRRLRQCLPCRLDLHRRRLHGVRYGPNGVRQHMRQSAERCEQLRRVFQLLFGWDGV